MKVQVPKKKFNIAIYLRVRQTFDGTFMSHKMKNSIFFSLLQTLYIVLVSGNHYYVCPYYKNVCIIIFRLHMISHKSSVYDIPSNDYCAHCTTEKIFEK